MEGIQMKFINIKKCHFCLILVVKVREKTVISNSSIVLKIVLSEEVLLEIRVTLMLRSKVDKNTKFSGFPLAIHFGALIIT